MDGRVPAVLTEAWWHCKWRPCRRDSNEMPANRARNYRCRKDHAYCSSSKVRQDPLELCSRSENGKPVLFRYSRVARPPHLRQTAAAGVLNYIGSVVVAPSGFEQHVS